MRIKYLLFQSVSYIPFLLLFLPGRPADTIARWQNKTDTSSRLEADRIKMLSKYRVTDFKKTSCLELYASSTLFVCR